MTFVLAPCGMGWRNSFATAELLTADAMAKPTGSHGFATQSWAPAGHLPAAATAAVRDRRYVIRPRGATPV
jgi:hypothetical protein